MQRRQGMQSQDERQPLLRPPRSVSTVEERRLRNRGKRVKFNSKRLRQLWPRIAAFLPLRDGLAMATTCKRMMRLIQDEHLWQQEFDRICSQQMTRLLLPHMAIQADPNLSMEEKLRRLIHARRVHDPTNTLQLRLREAERRTFRVEAWQRKMRSLVRLNLPLALVLCGLSIWSYCIPAVDAQQERESRPETLRGANGESQPPIVSPAKTFLVVEDLLLLVALVVLSVGDMERNALYTAAVLAAIQVGVMVANLAMWQSTAQVAHAFVVLFMLIVNGVLTIKKRKELANELDNFSPSY